jgi:hypothetical protein
MQHTTYDYFMVQSFEIGLYILSIFWYPISVYRFIRLLPITMHGWVIDIYTKEFLMKYWLAVGELFQDHYLI